MREAISLFIFYLGCQVPWTNDYFISFSFMVTFFSMIYFCMSIVDRFFVRDKISHRIGMKSPLSPLDDENLINTERTKENTPANDMESFEKTKQ